MNISKLLPLLPLTAILTACATPHAAPRSQKAPATQPVTQPGTQDKTVTVDEIRAIVLQAIAMKEDPVAAQALIVRANAMVPKLEPGSDTKRLVVTFDPDTASMQHFKPTATKRSQVREKLSPHLETVDTIVSSTYPFSGLADNKRAFIIPISETVEHTSARELQRDGKTIYRVGPDLNSWKVFHASPDETLVVLENGNVPLEILSVDSRKIVKAQTPEIPDHHNVYPLKFLRWNPNSRTFLTEATGTVGQAAPVAFRELWQIDAQTGKATKLKRQEQPYSHKLHWQD